MTRYRIFTLVRSDQGDGGWSLHEPDATDEEIAEGSGRGVYLVSGPSLWNHDADAWDRPDDSDYYAAQKEWERRGRAPHPMPANWLDPEAWK
jgi:hypothetical protein